MPSLHYLLMRSHSLFNHRILEDAAELGLSPGQPKVLEYLRLHGTQNQRSIADYCRIEPATVGSILSRMEEAGLVTVRVDNFSNNTKWVSLTPKGEMVAEILKDLFRILFDEGPCDIADYAHTSCYETLEGEFAQTIHAADRNRPDDGEHRTRQK